MDSLFEEWWVNDHSPWMHATKTEARFIFVLGFLGGRHSMRVKPTPATAATDSTIEPVADSSPKLPSEARQVNEEERVCIAIAELEAEGSYIDQLLRRPGSFTLPSDYRKAWEDEAALGKTVEIMRRRLARLAKSGD